MAHGDDFCHLLDKEQDQITYKQSLDQHLAGQSSNFSFFDPYTGSI